MQNNGQNIDRNILDKSCRLLNCEHPIFHSGYYFSQFFSRSELMPEAMRNEINHSVSLLSRGFLTRSLGNQVIFHKCCLFLVGEHRGRIAHLWPWNTETEEMTAGKKRAMHIGEIMEQARSASSVI
jgi:hypothetical protein